MGGRWSAQVSPPDRQGGSAVAELAASPEEDLEDGRHAATPDGDNLVLDYARAEAAVALAPLDPAAVRAGAPVEPPAGYVARGVGGCEELWVTVDDDGELTLTSAGHAARALPALPQEQAPCEVAARDGLVALRVDEVGVYQVLPGAQAAERLEATRGATAFTVMGARGARLPVVVSAHAEPGRVSLVAHGLDGPRVVGALEPRARPDSTSLAGAQLAYDPDSDCVYIATHLGLFAAWRPPRIG